VSNDNISPAKGEGKTKGNEMIVEDPKSLRNAAHQGFSRFADERFEEVDQLELAEEETILRRQGILSWREVLCDLTIRFGGRYSFDGPDD